VTCSQLKVWRRDPDESPKSLVLSMVAARSPMGKRDGKPGAGASGFATAPVAGASRPRYLLAVKTFLKILRRFALAILVVLALAALGVWVIARRATNLVNGLLRDYATQQATQLSDSVYVLHVGTLHFNWPMRRVILDSAILTTDSARNAARTVPMATVAIALRTCTISGIDLPRLVLSKGLSASHFGCNEVTDSADAPPDTAVPAPKPRAPRATGLRDTTRVQAGSRAAGAFLTVQQQLVLPRQVPALRIGRIVFPTLSIALRRRDRGGNDFTFNLQRAQLRVTDLAIDPTDTAAAKRPLFSRSVVLTAEGTAVEPDTVSRIAVGSLEVNLTDSTVTVQNVSYGPQISDAQYQRLSPYRHERIRVSAGRVRFAGLDVGSFAGTGALFARTLDIDSFRLSIRNDKRLPKRPGPGRPNRTIQGYVQTRPRDFRIDTIRVRGAEVTYEEWAERRDSPGRLAITRIDALGTSFRHVPGAITTDDPFILNVTALIVGRGRLRARFEVPLDAGRFTMMATGSLGPMPMAAFNDFVSKIVPAQVKGGDLQGLDFSFRVTDGVARGRLTPLFTGLSVDVTGEGATGVLGNRGIIGGIVRGAAETAAGMKVRSNNPGHPNEAPRVGTIERRFNGESLPSFFVKSLLSGLMPVVIK